MDRTEIARREAAEAGRRRRPHEMSTGSLRSALLRRLAERADRPQITMLSRGAAATDFTGEALLGAVSGRIAAWRDLFGPGPHVFVAALPPGAEFVLTLLAALIGGHSLVPVALPRRGTGGAMRHAVADCGATAVLCTAAQRDGIVLHLQQDGDDGCRCPVVAADAMAPASSAPADLAGNEGGHRTPAIIQYTSGSTRMPKGVRVMPGQILANSALVERTWGMNPDTVVVNWLPHYHDMGLMGGILYPLLSGARSIQMNPFDMIRRPLSWLRAISDYRATFSGGPAFAFADCIRRIDDNDCEGLDLGSWERAFCGAEPIPSGLLERFRDRFADYGLQPRAVFGCYGMAECTLFAAGEPTDRAALPLPPPGCAAVDPCRLGPETRPTLRITDPQTGAAVADGLQGEIWLCGASIADGYQNLPAETAGTFGVAAADGGAGWLRTGDLGVVSGDLLYVTGRTKDIVIVNGRKIAAAEIEWLAAEQDGNLNAMAAAAFMAKEAGSGTAVLFIELKHGCAMPADPDRVETAIRRAVLGAWGIRLTELRIVPRGRLQRTSSGKIRRQVIAQAHAGGDAPETWSDARPATRPDTRNGTVASEKMA